MKVDYLEMTPDDYEDAIRLWRSCKGIGLSTADEKDQIVVFLKRNPGLCFVARDGESLIGTVLCGHDGRRGYLYHMAVDPDYRERGIGRTLMYKALEGLKENGIQKCHIFVYGENRDGLLFWEKTGWVLRDELTILSQNLQ